MSVGEKFVVEFGRVEFLRGFDGVSGEETFDVASNGLKSLTGSFEENESLEDVDRCASSSSLYSECRGRKCDAPSS